jgi:glutamine cyclotransferase
LGIQDSEGAKSELIYIDTTSFDKYRFDQGVESLNEDNLSEWIGQVKEGKVEKWSGDSPKTEVPQAETVKETSETKQ